MHIAVIGCGPAGLAAVHAAYELDCNITLYAPMKKTPQHGAILLQKPIPGISNPTPDGYVKQLVVGGSILDYRYKLYGDINIGYSGDVLLPGYHAWDHVYAYNALWQKYVAMPDFRVRLEECTVKPGELAEMHECFDLVVCTAPLPQLCSKRKIHKFTSVPIGITLSYSYPDQPPDTSVFNAADDHGWLRSARIFGNDSTEWLPEAAPPGAHIIKKPISHTCTCYPHVLQVGRNGKWHNETWVDTAYFHTREAIIGITRKPEWAAVK
jgi:hypothetical protein